MDPQEEVNTGPLNERVEDKNWKTRLAAYSEIKRLMQSAMADDPIFDEYAAWTSKMVTDSNAGALDAGLECVLVFADMAPLSCIRQQADHICTGVINKALGANKASSVQNGRAIILKLMEVDDPSTCTGILLSKLSEKKPKIPPSCLTLIKEGIEMFGIRAFPVKDIISALGPVFSGNNSAAREVAMALMVDMTRWIGQAPFNSLVENLRSAQKTDFEKLCEEAGGGTRPVPTVYLRKEKPSANAASSSAEQSSSAEGAGTSSSSGEASAAAAAPEIDAREFVEEVDLNKKLKATNFQELIGEEKWSEQLKGLQIIVEIIGPTPKIKPGTDTHAILDTCKVIFRAGHVQLQLTCLRIIALLADGLRGEFGLAVRPLTQVILSKCKEKRLMVDVNNALSKIVQHCLGFESIMDDFIELIRNKKTPPHGKVSIMDFLTTMLRDHPGRISNDCMKPLADAFVAICEDSDPTVRNGVALVLAQLAITVKARGRVAVDAHRVLAGLETSAPRVFKKMQAAAESGAVAAAPTTTTTTTTTTTSRPKTAPPAAAKKAVSASDDSNSESSAPAATRSKRPTTSLPKKKKAATAAPSSSAAAPATMASAVDDDAPVDDLAISGEEAAAALEALGVPGWTQVMTLMESSKWQDKVEAYTSIEQFIKANTVGAAASAPLVSLVKSQHPKLKITNVNVFKAVLQVISTAAEHSGSGDFSRSAAMEVMRAWGDKIGDRKTKDAMDAILTAFSEAISPGFVCKQMGKVLDSVKAPLAHQYYLEWLKKAVSDFGPTVFPVKGIAAFCHVELENKSAPVRTGAVEVLGVFYNHMGPRFMSVALNDSMKPAVKSLLEAEFEKVGFDPSAGSKVSRAVKGQAGAAPVGGAIPRVDLTKAIESSVLSDLSLTNGKNSWENRKAAMEAIVQACEQSGYFVEGNSGCKGILKALKERLNDTQANLKPVAVTTIGHVLRSLDAEITTKLLRSLSGPLLGGISDNKKSMRDATIAALQMVVSHGGQRADNHPDSNLVGSLVPALAEAALNPVGRTELLTFFATQVESEASLRCDWQEVCVSLVTALQDRTQSARTAAEQLFCSLLKKGYVSRADAAKSFRDLTPATMRSLQAAMDRILNTAGQQDDGAHAGHVEAPVEEVVSKPSATSKSTKSASSSGLRVAKAAAAATVVEDAPPVKSCTSQSNGADVSDIYPLKKTSKTKRLDDFYKQNWPQPPEDPGPTEMSNLKSVWEPLMAPELYDTIFEEKRGALANQDSVMGAMSELMSLLGGEPDGATSGLTYGPAVGDAVLNHTDLILRWAALALCLRESTSGLMHVLLLISKVFERVQHANAQLHEGEITVILPALIERAGHKSERHKAAFKSVIATARKVVAPNRLCQLLVQGLRCKNKKSRVVCIEVIDLIIAESGPSVLGKQGIRDVGATFNTSNLDVGVRNAALDFCYTLYTCVGSDKDKLMKLLGEISEKAVPMIFHRIKEKEKQKGPETQTHPESSSASDVSRAPPVRRESRPEETNVRPTRHDSGSTAGSSSALSMSTVDVGGPTLNLTPLDEQRGGGFTMPEDGDAPFRLEMTPPEGNALGSNSSPMGRDTWQTVDSPSQDITTATRRISLGAEQHEEEDLSSSSELEGVIRDIWTKMDALLSIEKVSSQSQSKAEIAQDTKEYLKIMHSILREEWQSTPVSEADKTAILKSLPGTLDRVLGCLSYGFSNPLRLPSAPDGSPSEPLSGSVASHPLSASMDIGLISVSLAVLFAMLDRPEFCRGISEMSVQSILESGVRHLVDPRLSSPGSEDDLVPKQVAKGLNALVLKVACTAAIKPGLVMCAIVDNLMLCIPEKKHKKALPSECAKPLSRLLLKLLREEMSRGGQAAFRMPNVDSMRSVSVLNSFFNDHPASPPADDTPYCSAKTFLAQMVEALGADEVMRIASILKIPSASFLCRLVRKMGGESVTASSISTTTSGSDDSIKQSVVAIIDRITTSRDKIVPIRELHDLLKASPDVDVTAYLQPLSSTFRKFVIDTLAKLNEENDPYSSQSSLHTDTLENSRGTFDSASAGDGTEALRILEGLKAKPRQYRSSSTTQGTPTSESVSGSAVEGLSNSISRPSLSRSSSKNRAMMADKVKGTLTSLSASLSIDPTPGSPLAGGGKSVSSTDNDLAARLQRLKQQRMDQNR